MGPLPCYLRRSTLDDTPGCSCDVDGPVSVRVTLSSKVSGPSPDTITRSVLPLWSGTRFHRSVRPTASYRFCEPDGFQKRGIEMRTCEYDCGSGHRAVSFARL